MTSSDVIVVGAGLSGLVAARALVRAGRTVRVLEARDRVGGRTLSADAAGHTIDLGGQWLGDQHHRLRALAAELGIATFPQHAAGKKVLARGAADLRTFRGFLPKIGLFGIADLGLSLLRLERLARGVPLADPLAAPAAAALDARTLADWLERRVRTRAARELLTLATQMIFAAEPRDLSLLFFLYYAHSGGGLQRLSEIERGAQEQRFVTGAQSLCDRLAAALPGDAVSLSHAVHAIEQDAAHVTVRTAATTLRARRAILALPPAMLRRISFAQPLPLARAQLHARSPMGSVIKCVASYARPFWREAGYSGEAFSTTGLVRATFDDSSPSGEHAALVAFVVGDAAKQLSSSQPTPEARRAAVIADLARLHGPAAASPTAYVDKDWVTDEWAGGCYVGVMPPGLLSETAAALRAPVGRLHFAGTETAREHMGYLEGALEAGERAAAEVLSDPDLTRT